MPTGLFSSKQRAVLDAFPEVLSDEARDQFFFLSDADRRFANRFGDGAVDVAVMLGSLRMLGFVPIDLPESAELLAFVVGQLKPAEESRRAWGQGARAIAAPPCFCHGESCGLASAW